MLAIRERARTDPRWAPAMAIGGALAGCALVALVDPNQPGRYPSCPTRALLGIDCPACGTLRGMHALLHGRVGEALDHNLLLAVAVPWAVIALALWSLPLIGRPARSIALSPAALRMVIGSVILFAVVRNLPIPAFEVLRSSAR